MASLSQSKHFWGLFISFHLYSYRVFQSVPFKKFTKNEIFQQFIYTFLNNLCSASNKIKSRYDHSDLIHVPLYQSKSCFCRTYQTNFWDNFGIFFMSFRWKLIRLAIFQNIKGLGNESKLLIDFGTLNNILMHRRSVKLNMVKQ